MKFKKDYTNFLKYYDPEKNEIKEILNFCDFKNKVVLDLGCGEGKNTLAIATKAKYIYGVDPSKELLEIANKNKKLKNVEFRLGTAEKIHFPDNFFDVIITTWSLHHFDDMKKAMDEMNRVLKKDGELFFMEPTDNSEWNKIELEARSKLNKKMDVMFGEFWLKLLTFLNGAGFKWKTKIFEPLYSFPNSDIAVNIFLKAENFAKITNEPKVKEIVKEILKRYKKKNGSVEFHDQAFMVLAKR